MTNYSKIGFHGTGTGIGDYLRRLDQAGVPFRIKAVANGGLAAEAALLARNSGIPHQIVARWPQPAGRANDHPLVNLMAEDAAMELYSWISIQLQHTPEIQPYKDLIRIEPTNEISTSDEDPSWVGQVLYFLGKFLAQDGWSAALGGFNNGQPEPEHWDTPGMRLLLQFVGNNPMSTISVHEGKTTSDMNTPIKDLTPHIIGRFQNILWAADRHGIERPNIEVTEWGWAYNNMPAEPQALADLDEIARFYNRFPEVLGVYLWNLDKHPNWGQLPNKLAAFIPDVTNYSINTYFPDPDPPVIPPDVMTFDEAVWTKGRESQVLSLNLDAAIQKKAMADGFVAVGSEFRINYNGTNYAAQMFEKYFGNFYEARVYYCIVGNWDNIKYVLDPTGDEDIPPLGLTVPISGDYVILDEGKFNAPRDYSQVAPWSNQLHEGLDFASAQAVAHCLAPADGRVYAVRYSAKGYGHYVILEHPAPIKFYTYLAHMADVYVKEGDLVLQGQPVGLVGSSGNSSGRHVHLTVTVPGAGQVGYVIEDVIDPTAHIDYTEINLDQGISAVKFGLHATADPGLANGELDVFKTARPDVIKILSNLDPNHVGQLRARHPGVTWIVRAFLSMYDNGQPRNLTPKRFFDDTVADVRRTVDRLGQGLDIWVELHNEPNLTLEGWTGSWADGTAFNAWFVELLRLYREAFPTLKFLFPGLSPGPGIPGLRLEKYAFLAPCRPAMRQCDGVADHVYWGIGEDNNNAVNAVKNMIYWLEAGGVTSGLWLTEASNKAQISGSAKGADYVNFWTKLKAIPRVQGLTFFVASASHPDFQNEVWLKAGSSIGIAEVAGGR